MSLDKFFSPESVAIIGVSREPNKIGHTIFENFIEGKYKGKVFVVNPNVESIENYKSYPSVLSIEEKIDLAIIVVPSQIVPKVLKECVKKKVKAVIIISGGFSEIGEKGRKLEEKLKRIIKGTKTRVMGPNCLGVLDTTTEIDTLFHPKERFSRPIKGNISFISQSGAVGSIILDLFGEEKIGINKFISYENAIDINECDSIDYLGKDENTKIILVFLEAVKDGKRFIKVVKDVSKRKPIIILKGGKTKSGAKAALSHTGSLAGVTEIYSSVFKQCGVIEANNFEELLDFSKAFSQPLPKGNKIAVVTDGGGFGVLACDECERQGLLLPELPKNIKEKFKKNFPLYATISNPLDLTGDANAERFKIALEECLKSEKFDGVIAITLFQIPTLEEKITEVIIELKKYGKPILCCAAGGKFTIKLSKILEANGIPVYETPERAVDSMAALVKYGEWLKNEKRKICFRR